MRLTVLIEHRAVGQATDVPHLDLAVRTGLGAGAWCQLGQQDAIRQFANTGPGFFRGEKTLFFFQGNFALRLCRLLGDLRFVFGQYLLDLLVLQRQRFALIGLLQSFDQCLELQVRNLLTQAFAKACTQAVSEIVGFISGFFRRPGPPKKTRTAIKKGSATWALSGLRCGGLCQREARNGELLLAVGQNIFTSVQPKAIDTVKMP